MIFIIVESRPTNKSTMENLDPEKMKDDPDKANTKFSCKLTTPELQKRKATVLESLRKQMLEKKELPNGYAFKFSGSDSIIDELTEFVKAERECCDFFKFNIAISGD